LVVLNGQSAVEGVSVGLVLVGDTKDRHGIPCGVASESLSREGVISGDDVELSKGGHNEALNFADELVNGVILTIDAVVFAKNIASAELVELNLSHLEV
jgi:hypothetical protein